MSEQSLKNLIKALKQDSVAAHRGDTIDVYSLEVQILYRMCEGKTKGQIALDIGGGKKNESSVYNLMRELERLFARERYTIAEVWPILKGMVPLVNGRPQFEPWPPPESEPTQETIPSEIQDGFSSADEADPELITTPESQSQQDEGSTHDQEESPSQERGDNNLIPPPIIRSNGNGDSSNEPEVIERVSRSIPLFIWGLMLILGLIACGALLRAFNLGQRLEAIVPDVITREVEVTHIVQEFVEIMVPPDPNEIAQLVEGTVSAQPTQTPAIVTVAPVVVQETVLVTQIATVEMPIEVTREIQVLVDSEGRIVQTPTSIPEDQRVFVESFQDGRIEEPFVVVSGNPVFVNGILTTLPTDQLVIRIGDENWRNFEVEIQGYVWATTTGLRYDHFFVNVRAVDISNSYELVSNGIGNKWYIKANGVGERVPGDDRGGTGYWPRDGSSRLRIVVRDNQIQSYYNDQLQATFFDETHAFGGIYIRTQDNAAEIHRIQITRLD
jgi:hypothetical protein